ncbi:MAG: peptide ABC transporter substrate-binding protein [Treponema sp.]|jgi:peptide/nickel transport system substrate-binding protein|nr:peptide ABC transporter substrate-binding protein [Treponema sp.]
MRNNRKSAVKITLLLQAAVFLVFIPGCERKTAAPSPPDRVKIINIGVTNDPATVNPLGGTNVMINEVSRILFMPLAALDENLDFILRLAESITTTDNVTFTVKLNRDVRWTDGLPVTADDVIFALNAFTNPVVGVPDPSSYNIIAGTTDAGLIPEGEISVSGARKIDDYTLTIQTKYPVSLTHFHLYVSQELRALPKHILENAAPERLRSTPLLQSPEVSNGPFKFKEYSPSLHLSFEANKDYFLGPPNIDILNFAILSGAQITAQLESGEIDMNFPIAGNIPNDDYERIRSLPHLRTAAGIPSNIQVLYYNTAVIDNVKARQAMDLAIDRDGILKNVLSGEAVMTRTPVTNRIEYWNEQAARYAYDPERARSLLAESGWDLSRRLVFLTPTGNTTRERVCAIIAENFKAIGLNIVIERADFTTVLGRIRNLDYDISIMGMPDSPLNIISFLRMYVSKRYTFNNYSTPRSELLVKTIEESIDTQVLKDAYYELQQLIADEAPVSGLYSELGLRAVNRRVIHGDPKEYGPLLDVEQWDVL